MKRLLPLLLACITLFTPSCHADTMEGNFEWFTKLGYPDVKGLQFVHFIQGWSNYGNGDNRPDWSYGFLLQYSPDEFKIQTLNFQQFVVQKHYHADLENRYEPADLAAYAQERLDAEVKKPNDFRGGMWFGPHLAPRTDLFVLAWACWRQGLDAPAARLYEQAQKSEGVHPYQTVDDKDWPFSQKLERDLGQFELWRIMLDFGDPRIERPELLKKLHRLESNFPHCDYIPRVKSTAATLEKMIPEDDAHPRISDEKIAKLPPQEQVKEWIFRLRDQNGQQNSQPGWVNIFMVENRDHTKRDENSPAHRLVALGDEAVPQLIEALGDTRFTRSVGYGRDFFFSHEVLTIGDAALKIIERIASREFYRSGRVQGSMAQDKETDEVRASVENWWKQHLAKGDKAEMSEAAARGAFNSPEIGAKLLAKYPADAATPIMAGALAAKDWRVRSQMFALVGKVKDDRVQPFLLKEVNEGTDISARTQAAYELLKLGNTDGIAPLIEVWKNAAPVSSEYDQRAAREKLIALLALSNSPAAIEALGSGLMKRPAFERCMVLKAVDPIEFDYSRMAFGDYQDADTKLQISPEVQAAIEALLVAELEDTGDHIGFTQTRNETRVPNFRLADFAAFLLSQRWPDRYQFDTMASYPVREHQRLLSLNTWRKAHALPPLPMPPEPAKVKHEDAGKIAQVIFDGAIPGMPDALKKTFTAAKGREVDAALFHELTDAYQAAMKDGWKPETGFRAETHTANDGTGALLIIYPAGTVAPDAKPKSWHMECKTEVTGGWSSTGGTVEASLEKIKTLPPNSAVNFEMTYAP